MPDKSAEMAGGEQNKVNAAARELFLKSKKILSDGTTVMEDFKITPEGGIINTAQFRTMETNLDKIIGKTTLSKDQAASAKDAFTKAQIILSFSQFHEHSPGRFPFPKDLEASADPQISQAMVALLSKNVAQLAEEPGKEKTFVIDPKDLDKSPLPDAFKRGVRETMGNMGFTKTAGGTEVATTTGASFVTEIGSMPKASK